MKLTNIPGIIGVIFFVLIGFGNKLNAQSAKISEEFIDQGLSHYAIKYNRFMGVMSDKIFVVKFNIALCRGVNAGDQVEDRGFAGTIGSDESPELPLTDVYINAIEKGRDVQRKKFFNDL